MLPIWSHGFFSKAFIYNDTDGTNAINSYTKFSQAMPIEGLGLPITTLTNATNLGYKNLASSI